MLFLLIRVKILIIYSGQIYAANLLIAIVYVINGSCRRGQQTLRDNLTPIYLILALKTYSGHFVLLWSFRLLGVTS